MFFATKAWVAGAFHDKIQVWKTKNDIQLLFLVNKINNRAWVESSLPHLYKSLFPNESSENIDDLDIKHFNISRRDKLINKLYNKASIKGWFTSLENKIEIEICLFNSLNIASNIYLKEIIEKENKTYFKDSLEVIKIKPAREFYVKTQTLLEEKSPLYNKGANHFLTYKKWMNSAIQEEMKNYNLEREIVRHHYYNLRMKLEI